MGLWELVNWAFPVSDLRCHRWYPGVCTCNRHVLLILTKTGDALTKVDLLENYLTMVKTLETIRELCADRNDTGVDALNTTLECLLFAAAMNLGQGWKTVATLFACKSAM